MRVRLRICPATVLASVRLVAIRVYLDSLGCKLNQCERDTLAGQFIAAGYEVVPDPAEADLCVLNSCAVTHSAVGKSRRRLRALRRANPAARLVVTGCLAGLVRQDRTGAGAAGLGGVKPDLVVPNAQKESLVARVQDRWGDEWSPAGRAEPDWEAVRPRTRPLVKIQDGCDNACAYCIVHRLRGPQRSRPRDEIVAEVLALQAQGCHEVVLTGVHVGAYGRERGESLAGLVRALLAATDSKNPPRLRLSSIEPWDLSPAFFALWQDPRLCRHLHLPLQSGCDATLARMGRHYTTAQYAAWVAQARAAIPGLAVTTDVIAGLPGETADEHAASAAFCAQTAFARTHVFSYSARPGTPAAGMPDQVPPRVRRARADELKAIGRRSAAAFARSFAGQTLEVVVEKRRARGPGVEGWWTGLTDNYLRVYLESARALSNTRRAVRLCEPLAGGLRGELVEDGTEE
jgi:threonylcarbamoyladenosine tRNA methylthiotransferase MtaB